MHAHVNQQISKNQTKWYTLTNTWKYVLFVLGRFSCKIITFCYIRYVLILHGLQQLPLSIFASRNTWEASSICITVGNVINSISYENESIFEKDIESLQIFFLISKRSPSQKAIYALWMSVIIAKLNSSCW